MGHDGTWSLWLGKICVFLSSRAFSVAVMTAATSRPSGLPCWRVVMHAFVHVYINIYGAALTHPPPPPPMV